MTREEMMQAAATYFESGAFRDALARRVACQTESQNADRAPALMGYLTDEMIPQLKEMGFECQVVPNPVADRGPFLLARRIETDAALTVLTYGHGDVVMGMRRAGAAGCRRGR